MASQMYKSKLFCTSQIILYIPNYFVHPKLFCTSQIILYIPNYFVHPKLFCTSQIILYIPNYFVYHKLFCTFQINIYILKSRNNLFTAPCVTNLYIFLMFIIAILRGGAVYKPMININNLQKRKDAL